MSQADYYVKILKATYENCSYEVLLGTIEIYKSLVKNKKYSSGKESYEAGIKYFYSLIDKMDKKDKTNDNENTLINNSENETINDSDSDHEIKKLIENITKI